MGFFDLLRRKETTGMTPEQVKSIAEKSVVEKRLSWATLFAVGGNLTEYTDDKTLYKNIASVYKPIKAIVDNAPQAKIAFFNKAGEMVEARDLQERFARPNASQTYNDFIGEIAGYYSLHGEAFLIVDADTVGEQVGTRLPSLVPANPIDVTEVIDEKTKLIAGWKIYGKTYTPDQVIVMKDFNPYSKYRGLSPLLCIQRETAINRNSLDFNKAFFENDATPGLTLETDRGLTDQQRKDLETGWKAKFQGARRAFKFALLEGGLKAKPVTVSHKEMDFVEQTKLTRDEIIGTWRAPKALFNITDGINYATFNGQMKVFWIYTLMPLLRKVEDALNVGYVAKYGKGAVVLGFDYRNVPAFQEDFKDKVNTAQMLFNMGFTRNEINEELELGFEPKSWGEEWWIGAGMSPASGWEPPDPANQQSGDGSDNTGGKSEDDAVSRAVDRAFPVLIKHGKIIKGFLKRQGAVETRMFKKLKRHFYDVRARLLALPDVDLGSSKFTINWESAKSELRKMVEPIIKDSIDAGIQTAEDAVGKQKDVDQVGDMAAAYLQVRADKITGIDDTVRKQILKKVQSTLTADIVAGKTMEEIASGVRDIIRDYFNNAGVKAKLIARTETIGAMNGGSLLYYKEAGLDKKVWLTANDELVRESHRQCQEQGPIDLDAAFSNGLLYPGDQETGDAGETCNCRCALAAE